MKKLIADLQAMTACYNAVDMVELPLTEISARFHEHPDLQDKITNFLAQPTNFAFRQQRENATRDLRHTALFLLDDIVPPFTTFYLTEREDILTNETPEQILARCAAYTPDITPEEAALAAEIYHNKKGSRQGL